jgi:Cys-tRNA(Pro)/Cys-tRNA(Cys) deacylase
MEAMEGEFDVVAVLEQAGVPYTVRHHGKEAPTSEVAAAERGVRLSQIAKVLLVRPRSDPDEVIVVVLPGDRRVSWDKVKTHVGGRGVTFVERETIEHRLGLVPGAISPLHPALAGWPMLVDEHLLQEEDIDLSTGSLEAGVEIPSRALRELLPAARFADVSSGST